MGDAGAVTTGRCPQTLSLAAPRPPSARSPSRVLPGPSPSAQGLPPSRPHASALPVRRGRRNSICTSVVSPQSIPPSDAASGVHQHLCNSASRSRTLSPEMKPSCQGVHGGHPSLQTLVPRPGRHLPRQSPGAPAAAREMPSLPSPRFLCMSNADLLAWPVPTCDLYSPAHEVTTAVASASLLKTPVTAYNVLSRNLGSQ